VGPDEGDQCVIIDPGQDAAGACSAEITASGRKPMAILATHGHIDHIADAAEMAGQYSVPLYIHPQDRAFLTDPLAALSTEMAGVFPRLFPGSFREPADVREYETGGESGRGTVGIVPISGSGPALEFELRHAPGHTPGCTLLVLAAPPDQAPVVFTGDVVFAGSIGRTDFEVSSPAAMRQSLRRQVLSLPGTARLLPGHGPATLMGRELASNHYLSEDFLG
jgi:glyoxylase-like metal-dependent hydrolase (beta-lactamase superfamily II)